MPSSTCRSSNPMETLSKTTALAAGKPCSRDSWGAVISIISAIPSEGQHQEPGDDGVGKQDKHGGSDHSLRRSAANALGSPPAVDAIEAADGGDNEAEDRWLEESHDHVVAHQRFPSRGPVLSYIQPQQNLGDHHAAEQPHEVGNNRQKNKHVDG